MTRIQGQTGHDSLADRRAEMQRLVAILEQCVEQMSPWEQRFVTDMSDNLTSDEWVPTPAQLFKARDLNTKY